MKKINPKTLSLFKARADIQSINRSLVKNLENTAIFENTINTFTANTLKLIRQKQDIKNALAQKSVKSKHSKIEIKRLLGL